MSVPRKVGIDFETYLITPGCNTPRPICFAILENTPALYTRHEHAAKIVADLKRALADENCFLIGHNIIFDFAVACAEWPELIPLVFAALAAGRVWDNMIVELLYNMAHGEIDYRPSSVPGVMSKSGYGLDDLARRWLGVRVEKKDTWRLRYSELDYVPLAEWPPEAVSYPLGDVEIPFKTQWAQQEAISKLFDGKRTRMPDHEAQHRAAWWMYLMSTWGVRTNAKAVRVLQDEIEKEMSTLSHGLVQSGVLTMALKRDMKKVREYVVAGYAAQGLSECVPKTPTGAVATDEETLEASQHPALQTLGQYVHLQKMLNTYVLGKGKKNAPGVGLVHGIDQPICARYRVLVATGRTSCQRMNLQNPPRKGGIRECFEARPGYAYVSCDYDTAELRALAQVTTEKVGFSVLGDTLRAGQDPHLYFASRLMSRDYEDCYAHRDEKAVAEMRQFSKIPMFGFPGGLGAEAFVAYANGYGVDITMAEALRLRTQWLDTFLEMPKYFALIGEEVGSIGETTIRTLGSGRLHGARGFCQAANLYFQGMVADGAKRAGWFISYECYVDESSPLFGSRIAMFLHDEFILEVPLKNVHAAAKRLEELMIVGMSHFIKVVPVTCTAAAMYRWYKGVKPVEVNGVLVPGKPVEVDGETKWVEDRRAV